MNINYKPALPNTPQPIAIIGAGGIVNDAHLPAYRLAGFPVFGIWNRNRDRATALAQKFGIPNVFDSVEAMVAAAPEGTVFDLAQMPSQFVDTLRKLPDGAPVLIQKPMGDTLDMARDILAVCQQKKLKAGINCQLRFTPFVAAARDLISQGLIGELYDMEVRVSVQTPWDLFPNVKFHPRLEIAQHSVHYIDLIRSFFGNPRSVMAKTCRNPAKPMSSTRTTLIMDYGDAIRAGINTNHDHDFCLHNQESFIKWEGTKGAIKAKMGLLMNYPHGVPDKFEVCLKQEQGEPVWQEVPLEGSWFPEAFVGTMASLMRYSQGSEKSLPTDVNDVIHTMAAVEAAYISSASGGIDPSKL
jgi:predicted dehydrogenase